MPKPSRRMFFLVLVVFYPFFGCGIATLPPASTFQVIVFSDVHFNPFYDTTLFPALLADDPTQWQSVFQSSAITAPSAWNSDTNYPLLVLALAGIKQNLGASPVILYTGDLLGHNFPQDFYQLYGSQDLAALQAFADKTVTFVTSQIRANMGSVPVVFAVGNIDSYTGYGPDSVFLANNAQTFYTQLLNSSVDQAAFMNTFTAGGYYSAEPLGSKLLVIGLNTNPFSPLVPGNNQPAVTAELAWLDTTLASAQAAGQKVWLLMHVPPGADTVTTASKADINGHITTATATMMWVQEYQEMFLTTIRKYPGVITLTVAAHTHMDEFRILLPNNAVEFAPAISPVFGNDPAFKIVTFTQDTLTPIDYRSLDYDLATLPAQFSDYYTFSATYSVQGPFDDSFPQLYPQILANNARRGLYSGLYQSGHNYANPITAVTWPIFACGIENIAQQDLINCVNAY